MPFLVYLLHTSAPSVLFFAKKTKFEAMALTVPICIVMLSAVELSVSKLSVAFFVMFSSGSQFLLLLLRSVIMQSIIMLSVIILTASCWVSLFWLSLCWVSLFWPSDHRYAECHYAECHYAECHYTECHYAECHFSEYHYAKSCYASFRDSRAKCRMPSIVIIIYNYILRIMTIA